MPNYKNAKIYAIKSFQTDKIYIGSTCERLRRRLYNHKSKYKQYLNSKFHFVYSFEIIKYPDAYIELLEKYPCNDKAELHKREGECIKENNCVNKNIAGRKKEEYYKERNLKKIKCYCGGSYVIRNKKTHIKTKKHKQWVYDCECGRSYLRCHKARHLKSSIHKRKLEEKLKEEKLKKDI